MQLASRKFFLLIFALVGVGLVTVGGLLWFASAQEVFTSDTNNNKQTAIKSEEPLFQYSAPWDKAMFDNYYKQAKSVPADLPTIKGAIVPHHLLAGYIPATFFSALAKQNPSVIVIVSPNHFHRGHGEIITTERDWQTPYGVVETDKKLIDALISRQSIEVNEETIDEEHGIYGLVSFVKKSLPNTKLAVLSLQTDAASTTLDSLAENLTELLPSDAVIVASIDFSHYQTPAAANFHDELSMSVIKNFDYARLPELEIDSVPSLYVLLKSMERFGAQRVAYEIHANSDLTSYYSPYFTEGKMSDDSAISILNFGDMMLDRNVKKQIDANGKDYLLEKLAGEEGRFFQGMDIISANLEGPFADKRRPTSKSIAFRFDPILIPMLKKYNLSLFTLANNHSYDMGAAGFNESKENLRRAGIDFYGSQYQVNGDSYIVKQVGSKKIAFIGVNDTNTPVDIDAVKKLIKKGETEAIITIVNIHWGVEYQELSAPRQRELAHIFIDAGADAIIGHHPHVVEEMEVYKDRPIFYSLGNFIFDQYFSVPTQEGLGVGLVFHPKEISVNVFPLQGKNSQVTQMSGETANSFMRRLIDRSRLGAYDLSNSHLSIPIFTYGK